MVIRQHAVEKHICHQSHLSPRNNNALRTLRAKYGMGESPPSRSHTIAPLKNKRPGNRLISALFNLHRAACHPNVPFGRQTHPSLFALTNPNRID